MSKTREGTIIGFKEQPGGIAALLVAQIRNSPGVPGTKKKQQSLLFNILRISGIDLKVWEVEKFDLIPNSWGVSMKLTEFEAKGATDDESYSAKSTSEPAQMFNFQLKVIIKLIKIAPVNHKQFQKNLLQTILRKSPTTRKATAYSKKGRLMLLDIPDHHLARTSWGKETGDDYDIKIAAKRYRNSIDFFLEETTYIHKRHPIEQILFVLGNDFFNYDYSKPYPHTSNNTPQESDSRQQKMFRVGSGLVIEQLEACANIAPVRVVVIPGNHDEMTSLMLGQVVEARFYNNSNIDVETSPTLRKYEVYGKNLLGFSHGQYESFERLFANMALQEQEKWGKTIYKFMYTGHMHHKETKVRLAQGIKELRIPKAPVLITEDLNGVMFDRLGSLTSNDYYEASRGYIHIKQAESFLFDKEIGKVGSLCYQLPLSIHSKGNR